MFEISELKEKNFRITGPCQRPRRSKIPKFKKLDLVYQIRLPSVQP